jgi:hypothetical protein
VRQRQRRKTKAVQDRDRLRPRRSGIVIDKGRAREPHSGQERLTAGIARPNVADMVAADQLRSFGGEGDIAAARTDGPLRIAAKRVQSWAKNSAYELERHGSLLDALRRIDVICGVAATRP